ncbi:MAG: ATP-binding protein [Holophagales bacterium]|nr:ATP-binding protein [Holophagales bacterium]MYF06115.1 ATP-binding protein [Holophagales bacterium]MYJ26916.1 ATP-binding protein [Holophagales bacterium]
MYSEIVQLFRSTLRERRPAVYTRELRIQLPRGQSAFLWGARKTGKSTLIQRQFPESICFDLLDTRLMLEFTRAPWTLGERIAAAAGARRELPILIDEVQKAPALLDEVHRLIEAERLSFVLCGSSARKLKRGSANLLGGRAWRFALHPLTWCEIPGFDLLAALNRGLVPEHYDSAHHRRALAGYVDDYLKEEVFDEGLTRNAPAFSRFFEALAFCNGEMLNYSNVARDCGVSSKTVKEYFQILVDTLLGVLVEPFSRRPSRSVIVAAPKFYLFDVGVANHIAGRRIERASGPDFGRALEHFVLMELLAYRSYRERDFPIRFWRTRSGRECDFVLGRDGSTAIEVKGGSRVRRADLKGLRAFVEEHRPRTAIVVCNEDAVKRTADGIWIVPWERFLERLWGDDVVE